MEAVSDDKGSIYEQLVRFTRTHAPPQTATRRSRVRPASRMEMYIAAGMLALPIILIILNGLIAGDSFIGDILNFGLMGVFLVGIVYALSVAGSMILSKRGSPPAVKWVAAVVLEQDTRFDEGIPVDYVVLELEDGRRVTLKTDSDTSDRAQMGTIGWANIEKSTLVRFVAE